MKVAETAFSDLGEKGKIPEPIFVDLLRSPGIDFQPGGPVRQPYLPARLYRLGGIDCTGLHKRLQIRPLI